MKQYISFLLSIFLLLEASCASFNEELVKEGGYKDAIQNAIVDFSNTCSLYNRDSVFSVTIYDPLYEMIFEETDEGNGRWVKGQSYKGVLAISISANYHKIFLMDDSARVSGQGGQMPTQYIEVDGKLFYWWDSNCPLTEEVLNVFKKYDLLVNYNLDRVVEFYDFSTNDSKKGVDYYFCKNDLSKYKEVVTNKGIGYYPVSGLNCE